ncbi:monooxygenase [Streptomyces qinzhouensis]|uniref:Monooxygenase n=1 Tax=Streptomyces qinzhouensis TaxID=2599401 RepID=A0A5B8JE93_9ACTN|nr:monooxygenase [Streptomyces qinzhouensis]QDY79726.1 monooxygenase [Streptomyces qinzhouensis]
MPGTRVAVVGGSIAGCAAALALYRTGHHDITVHERTSGELSARGVGVAVHEGRYTELAAAGYLDPAMTHIKLRGRHWYVRSPDSGPAAPLGRLIRTESFDFRTYNWGPLWRELRARVPAGVRFRPGSAVTAAAETSDGALLTTADGTTDRYDLIVGADGYRSVVRAAVHPGLRPAYAGYLAWRGAYPEDRLPDGALWDPASAAYVVFPGGHVVLYRIPGDRGGRRVNWVLYTAPPPGPGLPLDSPGGPPPGRVGTVLREHLAALTAAHFPPFWRRVIDLTEPGELFVQPMYDALASPGVTRRIALIGDAATVARPHTGAGAVKALQDATLLEAALRDGAALPDALSAYDSAREALGRTMVGLGRSLGTALVTGAPDWRTLDDAALAAWWRAADAAGAFGGTRTPERTEPPRDT